MCEKVAWERLNAKDSNDLYGAVNILKFTMDLWHLWALYSTVEFADDPSVISTPAFNPASKT